MKKLSLKLALAAALTMAALSVPSPSHAVLPGNLHPTACPENYAPVICSNGVVYANSCFASADGATGCVPYADPL